MLLKAAEKRLPRSGGVEGVVETLGAKNIHQLLPPPSTLIKVGAWLSLRERVSYRAAACAVPAGDGSASPQPAAPPLQPPLPPAWGAGNKGVQCHRAPWGGCERAQLVGRVRAVALCARLGSMSA